MEYITLFSINNQTGYKLLLTTEKNTISPKRAGHEKAEHRLEVADGEAKNFQIESH